MTSLANATLNTLLPLALSSAAAILVGFCLQSLLYRRQRIITLPLIILHSFPLLIAPPLVSYFFVVGLETGYNPIGLPVQSVWTLAIMGFVFHCAPAFFILHYIFELDKKIIEKLPLIKALGMNRPWSAIALVIAEFGPSMGFTFALLFILQEGMLILPRLLAKYTTFSEAIFLLQRTDSPFLRFMYVSVILLGCFVLLMAAYFIPQFIGTLLLRSFSIIYPKSRQKSSRQFDGFERIFRFQHKAINVILFMSSVLYAAILFIVCCGGNSVFTNTTKMDSISPSIIETFWAHGIRAGLLGISMVIFINLWRQTHGVSLAETKAISLKFALPAFMPPAILGTIGLIIVFEKSSAWIMCYLMLAFYAASIMYFISYESNLRPHALLRQMGSALRLPFRRRLLIFGSSAFGGIPFSLMLSLYFLWIEDGIQMGILGEPRPKTLGSLLRFFKRDHATRDQLREIIMAYLIWACCFIFVGLIIALRYKVIKKILFKMSLLPPAILLIGIGIGVFGQGSARSDLPKSIKIYAGESYELNETISGEAHLNEVSLNGQGRATINVRPNIKYIYINKLKFYGPNIGIEFRNGTNKPWHFIEVLKIEQLEAHDTHQEWPRVMSIDRHEVEISDLCIKNLEIRGTYNPYSTPLEGNTLVPVDIKVRGEIHNVLLSNLFVADVDFNNTSINGGGEISFDTLAIAEWAKITSNSKSTPFSFKIDRLIPMSAESTGYAALEISKLDMGAKISLGGLKTPRGSLRLWISNVNVNSKGDREFIIKSEKVDLDFLMMDARTRGSLKLFADNLRSVKLFNVKPFDEGIPVDLIIQANSLTNIDLNRVQADRLELSVLSSDQLKSTRMQAIQVTEQVGVSKNFVKQIASQSSPFMQRRQTTKLLREYGVYSETNQPIKLDALYELKKAELSSISPILCWIVDHTTGLGIRLGNPLLSATIVLVIGVILITFLSAFHKSRRAIHSFWLELKNGKSWLLSFLSIVMPSSCSNHHSEIPGVAVWLGSLLRGFYYLQITLLLLYMGGTVLEM